MESLEGRQTLERRRIGRAGLAGAARRCGVTGAFLRVRSRRRRSGFRGTARAGLLARSIRLRAVPHFFTTAAFGFALKRLGRTEHGARRIRGVREKRTEGPCGGRLRETLGFGCGRLGLRLRGGLRRSGRLFALLLHRRAANKRARALGGRLLREAFAPHAQALGLFSGACRLFLLSRLLECAFKVAAHFLESGK